MRFWALGDSAVVVELGDSIGGETLQRVRTFAAKVTGANLPGIVDVVPAFTTVAVFYDPLKFAAETESAHTVFCRQLFALAAADGSPAERAGGNEVTIPVCYGGEEGPDLAAVAAHAGISLAGVIQLHSAPRYLVHAIGFAPGFPYLGGLPEKLRMPRLDTPRTTVPAGSVGIGGAQTGVYPLATPGGWHLIGRTSRRLFDPTRAEPSLLRVGDRVRFQPVANGKSSSPFPAEKRQGQLSEDADPSPGINVVRAGMLTTFQDLGRRGHRGSGVPLGGAADALALRVANWLVDNHENAAALECTLIGPELEFPFDAVVALAGASFPGLPPWQPVRVPAGTRLKLGTATSGCRGYLAIAGGFKVRPVLGSASTYLRGAFGGFEGRALREGDVLRVAQASRRLEGNWRIDQRVLPNYSAVPTVRVVRGAHAEEFSDALYTTEFKVTPQSDRMGLRLLGEPALARTVSRELISTAVAPGTIQIPPDGQPIVLLADAQTIGGYPQAAHVIGLDLPLVAQLRPGDHVRFSEVSLDVAQKLFCDREHDLRILHEGLAQKFR
jgi:antagonist of KipI